MITWESKQILNLLNYFAQNWVMHIHALLRAKSQISRLEVFHVIRHRTHNVMSTKNQFINRERKIIKATAPVPANQITESCSGRTVSKHVQTRPKLNINICQTATTSVQSNLQTRSHIVCNLVTCDNFYIKSCFCLLQTPMTTSIEYQLCMVTNRTQICSVQSVKFFCHLCSPTVQVITINKGTIALKHLSS